MTEEERAPEGDLIEDVFGRGESVPIPDVPHAAETLTYWLITSPHFHPFWSQWILAVVRLRDDLPGFPAPHHKFEGTTHELLVAALNPEEGVYDVDRLYQGFEQNKPLPYLTPINICEQYIATDEEMDQMARYCVKAICMGAMSPEAPFSAASHRHQWLMATTKTLAHMRGEAHAP